jgi:hypothetical protein
MSAVQVPTSMPTGADRQLMVPTCADRDRRGRRLRGAVPPVPRGFVGTKFAVQGYAEVKACVAATGDNASRFDRLKVGVNGPMYVFRVDAPRRCPYGNHHDGSNNFSVLVRKRDLLYCCNSSECQGVRPLLKIGELTRSEAMIGGETRAFRADDVNAINGLHKSFADHWAGF